MLRFRSNDHTTQKNHIEEVINEVSAELGVDLNTKSIDEDPNDLAQKIEQSIKKRT